MPTRNPRQTAKVSVAIGDRYRRADGDLSPGSPFVVLPGYTEMTFDSHGSVPELIALRLFIKTGALGVKFYWGYRDQTRYCPPDGKPRPSKDRIVFWVDMVINGISHKALPTIVADVDKPIIPRHLVEIGDDVSATQPIDMFPWLNPTKSFQSAQDVIDAKVTANFHDAILIHNSKDKATVVEIATRLRSVGLNPWLDIWNLPPGTPLSDELDAAISASPCALICFGPNDTGRYQNVEIPTCIELNVDGKLRIVPVILPTCTTRPELPLFLRRFLYLDLTGCKKNDEYSNYQLVCGILNRKPDSGPPNGWDFQDVLRWQRKLYK